jgi:hypothetical protein
MTQEDYSKVPPPHLLKKFSEQAREDSQKRGHPGYCKTFAKLCIDWAFQEAAMDDLRVASAEVSGVKLNSKSSSNNLQIRSSSITPPPEWVRKWCQQLFGCSDEPEINAYELTRLAAQWAADQELDACCEWLGREGWSGESRQLRAARRPKPPSLKEQALQALSEAVKMADDFPPEGICSGQADIIRRALEQLPE